MFNKWLFILLSCVFFTIISFIFVATPLWPSVGVKPNTPKVGDLESSRTPECLEFNIKAQNYSHWGVLGVIEKVLKRRYRKWPRIGHLDICSSSYGQKKGREHASKSQLSATWLCGTLKWVSPRDLGARQYWTFKFINSSFRKNMFCVKFHIAVN
jgi:hypothetical protein